MSARAPALLDWARRLQAIAQSGVAYGEPHVYDRERYGQVRRIAAEMLAADGDVAALDASFADEEGHATPKLDLRGVVFRGDTILLVRERGTWSLPGGWADVGESPSEGVVREIREEAGFETRAVKLLALQDRDKHAYPPHLWHVWKAIFLCELLDEEQRPLDSETDAAEFFPRDALPELTHERATRAQIERAFEHRGHPEWPADFD